MSVNEILVASLVAEMHSINAEVAGMIAENLHRELCNSSISYGEEAFYPKSVRLKEIADELKTLAEPS